MSDQSRESATSEAFSKMRRTGPIALFTLLVGCATSNVEGQIFDYPSPAEEATAVIPPKTSRKAEKPKIMSASALLGTYQAGPGYAVESDVISDGRYNTYIFRTEYGAYSVIGNDLTRKHIQELITLDVLKKRSKAGEFVHGVGRAVTGPVEGVFTAVTDPVGTTKGTYRNIERKVKSARHGLSEAGEFISTFGDPEKRRPDREDDGLIEGFVGRAKAKRQLATALMVDPYTHFVPLADELDKVASYSAAGEFGISKAVGFVPGVAGTVVSSLQTFDSFTEQTLDLDPGEIARVNRERLEQLAMPEDAVKRLLLNDKFTPTEKTQAVGYLHGLSGTPGLGALASFLSMSRTRHEAFAALQTLSYLATRPFADDRITDVEIIEHVPVLTTGDSRKVAIFTSDDLAWTHRNADQLSKLGDALNNTRNKRTKMEIRISGNASSLAEKELKRRGWAVKSKVFNVPR